ncbi:sodium:solute symporter family protein [Prochlorococcus sp. MIT 1341]|uniref:sodium:solute symporter family protein n=1 Tax=Prochlorococcus sp. MIT 1341 TaxID=3096221 RepID=UPI002A759B41|nr:sodium:solute symporter family protein [Prochlorococcus sp. MIT 1341]
MTFVDWLILGFYLLGTLLLGLWLAARNKTEDDYFVAGRSLSGWLAGASMAATTFSIDTPLYVAGLVGTRGLAANWEWWSFGLAHIAMAVIFAPLWRRSGVLTDAAFTELRYGGVSAAWLRGVKAFLLALPVNCIGIGYAFLAMRKVMEALGIVQGRLIVGGMTDTMFLLVLVAVLMLAYTVIGGLWAVVVNDLIQLALALVGAFAVAMAAVHAAGGMTNLLHKLEELNRPELLSLFPWQWQSGRFEWIEGAGISVATFSAFLTIQWWSFRRSDGGGEFIQRMLATRNEQEATLAAWVFLVVNYLLRSWLWIVVALASIVLLPTQQDWELSYPTLAVKYLPPVGLGLVVVSLVAAFMSTVSTAVNWGASYLTHDLYQRFVRPMATNFELVQVGQITSFVLLGLGVVTALWAESIGSVFRLVIAIGTGPGVVLVLRWFWWRVNAQAELAAMVAGFLIGFTTSVIPVFRIEDYGVRLIATTAITAVIWLVVLVLTPPESKAVLEHFVTKVQPPGPGWRIIRNQLGVQPPEPINRIFARFLLSVGVLYGGLLGSGAFILHQQLCGWLGISIAGICFIALWRGWLRRRLATL